LSARPGAGEISGMYNGDMTTYEYSTDTSTLNDHIAQLKQLIPTAIIDIPTYDTDSDYSTLIHVTTDDDQTLYNFLNTGAPTLNDFIKHFTYDPANTVHLL
jgi:uncharacterized membrane protein